MELSIIGGLFEQLSDAARAEVIDFARFLADKEEKQRKNAEYLAKLDRSETEFRTGHTVSKTMAELEAMAQ